MKFEEQFPSLMNTKCGLFGGDMEKGIAATEEYILLGGVQEHCLDKQRVKETLDKLRGCFPSDDCSINQYHDRLLKVLNIRP